VEGTIKLMKEVLWMDLSISKLSDEELDNYILLLNKSQDWIKDDIQTKNKEINRLEVLLEKETLENSLQLKKTNLEQAKKEKEFREHISHSTFPVQDIYLMCTVLYEKDSEKNVTVCKKGLMPCFSKWEKRQIDEDEYEDVQTFSQNQEDIVYFFQEEVVEGHCLERRSVLYPGISIVPILEDMKRNQYPFDYSQEKLSYSSIGEIAKYAYSYFQQNCYDDLSTFFQSTSEKQKKIVL